MRETDLRLSIIFSQTVDLPEAEPPATPIKRGGPFSTTIKETQYKIRVQTLGLIELSKKILKVQKLFGSARFFFIEITVLINFTSIKILLKFIYIWYMRHGTQVPYLPSVGTDRWELTLIIN